MTALSIRLLNADDKDWVAQYIREQWGADIAVAHGTVYYPRDLPGFIALQGEERVGLVTYQIAGDSCEIVTIDSDQPSIGVGTALIDAVKEVARRAGCSRLWLITTNDNMNALRFYQKRGFMLVAIYRNALEQSRKLKPEIPLIGKDEIPLRDEIELEMML
jgi:ribosomal protein S18 acetylase RimI-like enzyme